MSDEVMTAESEPLTMSVPEFAKVMGISKRHAYEAIRRGEIEGVIHIGRRTLIARWVPNKLLGLQE